MVTLEVMVEKMPKLRLPGLVLDKMKNHGLDYPVGNQEKQLLRFIKESWKKEEIIQTIRERINNKESLRFGDEMRRQFESKSPVEVDTSKYHDFMIEEEERRPIGFRQKSTLQNPHNSYSLDTSNENIKRTKIQKFDALFSDI